MALCESFQGTDEIFSKDGKHIKRKSVKHMENGSYEKLDALSSMLSIQIDWKFSF